jgi:hypothetical protein
MGKTARYCLLTRRGQPRQIVLDKSFGKVKYFAQRRASGPIGRKGRRFRLALVCSAKRCSQGRKQQPKTNTTQMQNYCKTIGALAAASALVAGNASAEIEYEIHTGYTSDYLFRGANLGNDLVEVGVDMATEWNGLGLSAGVWYGSFNETVDIASFGPPRPLDTDFTELDIYAEVSKDFGFLTGAIGYIYYYNSESSINGFFPAGFSYDDSQEIYFSVSRDFGFAAASLTYYWAIEGDNDGYTELALSRSFELNPCLALNVGTSVGYLFEGGDFGNWVTKVSLDWGFVERAKLSPFVAVSIPIDDDHFYDTGEELVAGSMLSVSF